MIVEPQSPGMRLAGANRLLQTIATCGQRFFAHGGKVSELQRDDRGRVWIVDCYSGRRIYTHYERGRWRGFSQGGTMRSLIIRLRDYVTKGTKLPPRTFGPWPEWQCGGDLWGYGDDMEKVRETARELGIV